MVRMIEQETGRLEELTRGILDFARPPSIRPTECDLSALLGNVRALMLARAPTPEIMIEGVSEGMTVRGDPAALTQILLNLLDNARSATPGQEPISVVFERSANMATIAVLDRGEGLSAEAREHLFEPFFSTKVRGYGLGLAVSRRLAEAHGGGLELAPREGGGCRAELRLPDEVKQ
jgi:signal transduction histidine kinase